MVGAHGFNRRASHPAASTDRDDGARRPWWATQGSAFQKISTRKARNFFERFFNKIKHDRRIATSCDKTAENFLAALKLVAVRIWLRDNESMSLMQQATKVFVSTYVESLDVSLEY
jgi:hypothetical protein